MLNNISNISNNRTGSIDAITTTWSYQALLAMPKPPIPADRRLSGNNPDLISDFKKGKLPLKDDISLSVKIRLLVQLCVKHNLPGALFWLFVHLSKKNPIIARFHNCGLTSHDIKKISQWLHQYADEISLDMGCNFLSADIFKNLQNTLAVNAQYTSLNFAGCNIDDATAIRIGALLKLNSALTSLTLNANQIAEQGIKAISSELVHHTGLTLLNIGFNKIGNAGAKFVSNALKSNTTLINLRLDGNDLGDEGAISISAMLDVNTTLKLLSLIKNNIGSSGAKTIGNTLKRNSTLTSLNLVWNSLENKEIAFFLNMQKTSTTLTELHVLGLTSNQSK